MLAGIIILLLGIVFLINEMNLGFQLEFDLVWPVVLMVVTLGLMIKNRKIGFWHLLFMVIGAWYTLYYFDIIRVTLEDYLWPVFLIILGGAIISSKCLWNKKVKAAETTCGVLAKDGRLNFNGIFGGVKEIVKNSDFKGCVANGIFGGVELDLTKIKIDENVTIDANSIFGGIELFMPEDYNVVVNSFAIFGGNDNKINKAYDKDKKTIYVNCISIFGGTDIK